MAAREVGGLLWYDTWREAQAARIAAWEEGKPNFPLEFYTNELFGEVGEAANILKKLHREEIGIPGSRGSIEHLGEELADSLICLRNLAIKVGFDMYPISHKSYISDDDSFSMFGTCLGMYCGNICMSVLYSLKVGAGGSFKPHNHMAALDGLIHQTAARVSIHNFDGIVIDKWNMTSLKNGFPHRMSEHVRS